MRRLLAALAAALALLCPPRARAQETPGEEAPAQGPDAQGPDAQDPDAQDPDAARVFLEIGACAASPVPHAAIAEALALERGVGTVELMLVAQDADWRIAYDSEPCAADAHHMRIEVRAAGEERGLFERIELPEGSSAREQARAIALAMAELVGFAIERARREGGGEGGGDEGSSASTSTGEQSAQGGGPTESSSEADPASGGPEGEGPTSPSQEDGLLERGGGFAALIGGRAYFSGALLAEVRIELPILLSREQTFVLRIDAGGGAGGALTEGGGALTFASAGLAVTYWLELPEAAHLEVGIRLEGAYQTAVFGSAGRADGEEGAANLGAILRGSIRVLPLVHLDGRLELGARVTPTENDTSDAFAPVYLSLAGGISFP